MSQPSRRPTIYDVARDAGVSFGTVSRVLNGRSNVSEGARNAVLASIRRLGYSRHPLATGLATRATGMLGSLMAPLSPATGGYYWQELQQGVLEAAWRANYQVVMLNPRQALADGPSESDRLVEGVVLGPGSPAHLQRRFGASTPTVSTLYSKLRPAVVVDYRLGSQEAIEHLIGLGHRRIAVVAGAGTAYTADERLAGYRAALQKHGLPEDPELETGPLHSVTELGLALDRFLALEPRPTAFFVAADVFAIETILQLHRRGYAVPGDVSVIGFSDLPLASLCDPALTTVHVPLRHIGRTAVELLVRRLEDRRAGIETPPECLVVPTHLVVRGTTAYAPRAPVRA